jgi:tRNA threonylcarbamoyl adenosine modification protein YeaZ
VDAHVGDLPPWPGISLLAIDTSGSGELSIATIDAAGEASGITAESSRHQSRIAELVEQTCVRLGGVGAVEAVAVVVGPGSYTGLRVGMATASGIAFARRLRLYPLSSLQVAIARGPGSGLAVVDAGRGRVHAQAFSDQWQLEGPASIVGMGQLAPDIAVAGEPRLMQMVETAGLAVAPAVREGWAALAAVARAAVVGGQGLEYDQLTGDYG